MKKLLLIIAVILSAFTLNAQNVNIPDADFLKELIRNGVDADKDGIIQVSEASKIEKLSLDPQDLKYDPRMPASGVIKSMVGLEAFTNLKFLFIRGTGMESLDLRKNTQLTDLYFDYNTASTIDLSGNANLTVLFFQFNKVTSLNLSGNKALKNLSLRSLTIESVDLSQNSALDTLYVGETDIKNLDLSKNKSLKFIFSNLNKQLSSVKVASPALIDFRSTYDSLSEVDVTESKNLEYFACSESPLEKLDLSKNVNLKIVACTYNALTSILLPSTGKLDSLYVSGNKLTGLDITNCPALKKLQIYVNPFSDSICYTSVQEKNLEKWKKENGPGINWKLCLPTAPATGIYDQKPSGEKEKTLFRVLTVEGREIDPEQANGGVYIYQFTDGTVKRMLK